LSRWGRGDERNRFQYFVALFESSLAKEMEAAVALRLGFRRVGEESSREGKKLFKLRAVAKAWGARRRLP